MVHGLFSGDKHLRSSVTHHDTWLSHNVNMQGMERFTQCRGGEAGV